jgi:hypothetical protein
VTPPRILSRDQYGNEHLLEVLDQHGMVVIRDDSMIRLLAPDAAVELIGAILRVLGGRLSGGP